MIVDIGLSNIGSVRQALSRVGAESMTARSAGDLARADAVILPGVGAFGDGMAALRDQGLVEPLRAHAAAGRPLLGICLGMQLLASSSEEHGDHEGLGIVPGRVVRLSPSDPSLPVPNIGWCDIADVGDVADVSDVASQDGDEAYYFAHGYHLIPDDPADVAGVFDYGGPVTAIVRRGSVTGVQFHPEKSQDAGLEMLERFTASAVPA
jgi:glutamine amidotransferase